MSELKLRITVVKVLNDPNAPYGRTVTMIARQKDKEIVFQNESTDMLTITLDEPSLLCEVEDDKPDGKRKPPLKTNSFTVSKGHPRRFAVSMNASATARLKYKAKIGKALTEDPIIIIEP